MHCQRGVAMPMPVPGPMTSASPTAAAPAGAPVAPPVAAPPDASTATGEQRRGTGGKGPDRRNSRVDRRTGLDQRQMTAEESGYTGPERRSNTERRDTTG